MLAIRRLLESGTLGGLFPWKLSSLRVVHLSEDQHLGLMGRAPPGAEGWAVNSASACLLALLFVFQ